MSIQIYLISGFLGAGKTTLIQKFLKESFQGQRVILIENDFGEISVDAALLRSGGVTVRELNSGCICCSLVGDFVKAMEEAAGRFHPDVILIEPSGVGKLSDIIRACENPRLREFARIARKITVVDAKRCRMYLNNFGEFFADQIGYADAVVLRGAEQFPVQAEDAKKLVEQRNPHARIFAAPWEGLDADRVLSCGGDTGEEAEEHHHGQACCGRDHHHDHTHDHDAEAIFETVTIRTSRAYSRAELESLMKQAERIPSGTVLRAKGIVQGPGGAWEVQYVPGDLKITHCAAAGGMLCFIGSGLNCGELAALFDGV